MALPTDGLIVDFDPEVAFAHLDPGDLVEAPVVSTDGRTYSPYVDEGVSHVRVGLVNGFKTLAPNNDAEWPWPNVETLADEPIELGEFTALLVAKLTEEDENGGFTVGTGGSPSVSYDCSVWYYHPDPEDEREEGLVATLYTPLDPEPLYLDPPEQLGGLLLRGDADGLDVLGENFQFFTPTSEADWRPMVIGTEEWDGLLFGGTGLLRLLVWDRALTEGEVSDVLAEWDKYRSERPDSTDVQLSWAPPAHDGGSPVTGYEVWAETEGGVVVHKTSEPNAELTVLRGGRVEVVAVNAAGRSTPVWVEQGEGGSS